MNALRRVSSPAAMQRLALRWKRQGTRIAFVPTMGFLHDGHLSLIRRARRLAGPDGSVVVSVFVNPTQFAPTEDLAKYPRDLPRDLRVCRDGGANTVFTPAADAMYPGAAEGGYSTYVVEEQLGKSMEGVSRPTHFRGVTTVVAKLFNLVLPDIAIFGAKDWQQAAIIRRMTSNLAFPVRVVVAPTVRERDGLAMSSRNKYLDAEQRGRAVILSRTLRQARDRVRAQGSRGIPAGPLKRELAANFDDVPGVRLDYLEVFDPATLQPADPVRPGDRMAIAAFVGATRLIDNAEL